MPNQLRSQIIALVIVLSVFSQTVLAQSPIGAWKDVEALASGQGIFIKLKSGKKFQGDLILATPDSIQMDADMRSFPGREWVRKEFHRDEVKEVRKLTRNKAIIAGAAIGGAIGAGLGIAADAPSKNHEFRGAVSLVLGVLGAAIGAGIGKHVPIVKGPRVYVAP